MLPERGHAAETGKREAEPWGTAAAMAVRVEVVGEFSTDPFFFLFWIMELDRFFQALGHFGLHASIYTMGRTKNFGPNSFTSHLDDPTYIKIKR